MFLEDGEDGQKEDCRGNCGGVAQEDEVVWGNDKFQ